MSISQEKVLAALITAGKPLTARHVAARVAGDVNHVTHTLDALFRRSLVTLDKHGRWSASERGERKAAA